MQAITFIGTRSFFLTAVLLGAMAGSHPLSAQPTAEQGLQNMLEEFRRSQIEGRHKTYDGAYQRTLSQRLMPYFENPTRREGGKDVFWTLIEAYTKGSRYDPFGQETIATLTDLAKAAGSSENSGKADEFRSLLQWHLPNYTVLEGVIPLVRGNPALGDIELLEWMHSKATDRLMWGPANSLGSPVAVISIQEVEFLLSSRARRVIGTEVYIDVGDTCYHIHTVENVRPDGPEKIYVLYSLIVRHVIDNYEIPTMPLRGMGGSLRAATPYCMHPFVAPDAPKR